MLLLVFIEEEHGFEFEIRLVLYLHHDIRDITFIMAVQLKDSYLTLN